MKKRELTIWDIIFWLGMLILIAYIVAKLSGIINTPEWINLIPSITLAFIIGAFYQRVIVFMNRMYTRTDYLFSKLTEHNKRLSTIEKQEEIFNKLMKKRT